MQKYDSHQDRLRRKLGADGSKITKEHNRASLQLLKKPTCKQEISNYIRDFKSFLKYNL